MVNAGLFRTKYWLLGAVFASLGSFAQANPSYAPHGVGASFHTYTAALAAAPQPAAFDGAYRVGARAATQYAGAQYAGAITPVSAETHGAPRPPANGQTVHTGSIRDDVARYNEERVSRPLVRPPADAGRPQGSASYRN